MALNQKVEIDRKVYTVNELTMQQIVDLTAGEADNIAAPITRLLEMSTDAKKEDILTMAPSEIQLLVDAMVNVNSPFFLQAIKIGAKESAEQFENLLRSIYLIAFLPSSPQATA